ncbi:MAG: InlB B-repeat-containing protein [Lachnospiraceae bacterium]|nr:InlB B-repeat-containing protein [Lachnospiraceae bacterium]
MASTSINGMVFFGKIKQNIDNYLSDNAADGNALNKLIVFNNNDINYQSDIPSYRVDFDTNGGSAVPSELFPADSDTYNAVRPENNPVKSGNDFVDWYTDKELTTVFDFNTILNKDITLFAKWTPATSSVTPGGDDNKDVEKDKNKNKDKSKVVTVTKKVVKTEVIKKNNKVKTSDDNMVVGFILLFIGAGLITVLRARKYLNKKN